MGKVDFFLVLQTLKYVRDGGSVTAYYLAKKLGKNWLTAKRYLSLTTRLGLTEVSATKPKPRGVMKTYTITSKGLKLLKLLSKW